MIKLCAFLGVELFDETLMKISLCIFLLKVLANPKFLNIIPKSRIDLKALLPFEASQTGQTHQGEVIKRAAPRGASARPADGTGRGAEAAAEGGGSGSRGRWQPREAGPRRIPPLRTRSYP